MIAFQVCLVLVVSCADGARILGIVPIPAYSHQVVFQPLWKELSLRGHQVTVITTNLQKDPALTNLTEIDVSETYEYWRQINVASFANKSVLGMFLSFRNVAVQLLEYELTHPQVQELLNDPKKRFDVVMVEAFYPIMYAFSVHFDCPLIGILSVDGYDKVFKDIGNPNHPVIYSDFSLPYTTNLTFWQRVHSVVYQYFLDILWEYLILYDQKTILYKFFGSDFPSLNELSSRVQMLFVNTDTVFHPVRALLPNVIQIGGGIHLKPPKPLATNLQTELDSAAQGVIYFSLGSNVKSKELTNEQRAVFLQTFAELPYKVLWKFELEDLPGKSSNVVISKWFPQADILRHPNVKLFITQGGLQSMEESIYSHVPMVGIPFLADQPKNVKRMVDKGMGLKVQVDELEKGVLKKAILEVITNSKYRDTVKYMAELAKDQPMTGLERAIWWTEYIIRHKGAPHLRSPLLDIPRYQYYLLDVIGFCVLVVFGGGYILIKTVVCSVRTIKRIFSCWKLKTQ